MNRLLSLKRSIVHIRRAVTPQREVLNQLTRHDFPFVRPENLVYFRDVYDHLIRIAEELDSLRDILSSVLEIHLASTSNQLNATMKRLTAYGTIFVAITAIAGIYGMNFKFIPSWSGATAISSFSVSWRRFRLGYISISRNAVIYEESRTKVDIRSGNTTFSRESSVPPGFGRFSGNFPIPGVFLLERFVPTRS